MVFTNNSTGPGTLTYLWDFGDGKSSTEKNATHTYSAKGTYDVALTVTSSEGCKEVLAKKEFINVANFTSDIEVESIICTGTTTVISNKSTPGANQTRWLIDGVEPYNWSSSTVSYVFMEPGNHTIELINTFGTCEQRSTKQVNVKARPYLTGFEVDILGDCGAPVEVAFKDTVAESVTRKWNFNYYSDYGVVHSTSRSSTYTYNSDNWYYASLSVVNAAGCSAEIIKQVGISKPLVGIYVVDGRSNVACDSLTTQFVARGTEAIATYSWNFGDNTAPSNAASPVHKYAKPGEYEVTLNYKTINGCTGTTTYRSVVVYEQPVAGFVMLTPEQVCGNNYVHFNGASTGSITWHIWNYGDNTGWQHERNYHRYEAAGVYDIGLIVTNGYCSDTLVKPALIKVSSPFPKIGAVTNTCEGTRGFVSIEDLSGAANKWTWDFGDGTTTTSYTTYRPFVTHTYTRLGNFKVILTTEGDNGCVLKDSTIAYITLKSQPILTIDNPTACINEPTGFHVRDLNENIYILSDFRDRYFFDKWEYADGSPINGSYSNDTYYWYKDVDGKITSNEIREDKIRLITTSYFFGCHDTTNYVPIRFKGVQAGFEVVKENVCFKSPVVFRDTSKVVGTNSITSWTWDFGDQVRETRTQGGIVNHIYANPGNYPVTLEVMDAGGCRSNTSSFFGYVRVTGPKAAFSLSTGNTVQLNSRVEFINNTNTANTNGITYSWDFGNGVTSAAYAPSYTYTVAGNYTVVLIAKNTQSQCADTARQVLTVRNFNTGFTKTASFIGDYGRCPPVRASFVNTSLNYTKLVWDFGDGDVLENVANPGHVYEKPGRYIITLNVYGYNGLTGTYRDTIVVSRPSASIDADDLSGCIRDKIVLHAPLHDGAQKYIWDFGNGYLSNAADSFSSHEYTAAGSFSPGLIVQDANGCAVSVRLQDKVIIHPDPVLSISPASGMVCKTNGVLLQATGAVDYQWTPVDGLSSAGIAAPTAHPVVPTTYTVHGTDGNGCMGTGSVNITVAEPIFLTIPANADICVGKDLRLNVSGASSYQWIKNTTGLSNTQGPDVVANPLSTSTYTVVGYDAVQCYSDTASIIVQVRALPTVNAGADKEVVYGSEVLLSPAASSDVVKWNWLPADYLSCDKCPSPVSKPFSAMEYIVEVRNNYDCAARDTILVKASCSAGDIYIPTGFTPNDDGLNDRFTVNGSGVRITSLRIYNRWGTVIFQRRNFLPNDMSSAWNGTYRGVEAPAGAYIYFVEMECNAGEKFTRKGTITLVR